MSKVEERYVPIPLTADQEIVIQTSMVSGFLAVTTGTITLRDETTGTIYLNACPVNAGVYTPIPYVLPGNRIRVTLAGGASGTLGL